MPYLLYHGGSSHYNVHIDPHMTADGEKVHEAKYYAW